MRFFLKEEKPGDYFKIVKKCMHFYVNFQKKVTSGLHWPRATYPHARKQAVHASAGPERDLHLCRWWHKKWDPHLCSRTRKKGDSYDQWKVHRHDKKKSKSLKINVLFSSMEYGPSLLEWKWLVSIEEWSYKRGLIKIWQIHVFHWAHLLFE